MNIHAWAASLNSPDGFYGWGTLNAVPYDLRPYATVLESVQGMTTPSTMHLLNLAVRHMAPDEVYLEVGTWRGATLIGALLDTGAVGYAVDNDTMNDHDGDNRSSQDAWSENVDKFDMIGKGFDATYIDGSVPAIWNDRTVASYISTEGIGVYLFDGDKSTEEAAYAGLEGVLPFLADQALIFVDDANEINIRFAVGRFERAYPHVLKILDIPTPGNCWPMFWNGIMALAFQRA